MESYEFSISVKSLNGSESAKQVEFVEQGSGIKIACVSSDGECVHFLHSRDFASFIKSLGASSETSVIQAVRKLGKLGAGAKVDLQVHSTTKAEFVWYDFDSPYYGNLFDEYIVKNGKWLKVN